MQNLLTSCWLQAQECSGASDTWILLGPFYLHLLLCIFFFQAGAFLYPWVCITSFQRTDRLNQNPSWHVAQVWVGFEGFSPTHWNVRMLFVSPGPLVFVLFTVLLFVTELAQREVWNVGMCLCVSQIVIFRYIHAFVYIYEFYSQSIRHLSYIWILKPTLHSRRRHVKMYLWYRWPRGSQVSFI